MAAALLDKAGIESGEGVRLFESLVEFKAALPEAELRQYERRRPEPSREADDAWEEPPRAATVGHG